MYCLCRPILLVYKRASQVLIVLLQRKYPVCGIGGAPSCGSRVSDAEGHAGRGRGMERGLPDRRQLGVRRVGRAGAWLEVRHRVAGSWPMVGPVGSRGGGSAEDQGNRSLIATRRIVLGDSFTRVTLGISVGNGPCSGGPRRGAPSQNRYASGGFSACSSGCENSRPSTRMSPAATDGRARAAFLHMPRTRCRCWRALTAALA
jgi:hypothetical protein